MSPCPIGHHSRDGSFGQEAGDPSARILGSLFCIISIGTPLGFEKPSFSTSSKVGEEV